MENTEQNKIWQDLILNPGNTPHSDQQWGLDDRLLAVMIEQGVVPRDILSREVEIKLEEASLPSFVHAMIEERIRLKCDRDSDLYIKVPLWIPWIGRRRTRGWEEVKAGIELMHTLGLVPWADPVCEFTREDVRGIDILFNMNWNNKREKTVLSTALSATSEEGLDILRNRTRQANSDKFWITAAKRSSTVSDFVELAAFGMWSKENDPGQPNDTFGSFTEKEMFDLAEKHGANLRAMRDNVGRLGQMSAPDKISYLEEIDRKLDREQGRETKPCPMDKIINSIAAGSSAIDSGTLERQLAKGKTKHRNGVGLGYTMLALANCSRGVAVSILVNVEKKLESCPDWEMLKNREAAGLEGSGITEGECFILSKILCHSPGSCSFVGIIDPERLSVVLDALAEQKRININWFGIFNGLSEDRLWLEYALSPNADPKSEARAKLLECIGGTTQFDIWVDSKRKHMPVVTNTSGVINLAASMLLCLGNTYASMNRGDREGTDKWAAKTMEYWGAMILTCGMKGGRFSVNDWDDENRGYDIRRTLEMFDPSRWAKKLSDCPAFQRRFSQFIEFLDRPLNMENLGYLSDLYKNSHNSQPEISPLDYMTKFMPMMAHGADNLGSHHRESVAIIKRTYLTAKYGMGNEQVRQARANIKM